MVKKTTYTENNFDFVVWAVDNERFSQELMWQGFQYKFH